MSNFLAEFTINVRPAGISAIVLFSALIAAGCSAAGDEAGAPKRGVGSLSAEKLGLIAPDGVEIGRTVKEVRAALLKAGFTELPQKCAFIGASGASVTISTVREPACTDREPVRLVYYVRGLDPPIAGREIIAAIDRAVGSAHVCTTGGEAENLGSCVWNAPRNFPKVNVITVLSQNISIAVTQEAVADFSVPNNRRGNFDKAFDPLAPVDKINPVAPGGLALGVDVAEASRQLREAGFQPTTAVTADGIACAWRYERRQEVEIIINLRASTAAHAESCAAGARLWNVDYRRRDMRPTAIGTAPSAEAAVQKWRAALRPDSESGACQPSKDAPTARVDCSFNAPAAIDGARLGRLAYQRESNVVSVNAQIVGAR